MGTPIFLRNIVGETQYLFAVTVIPLHRNFDRNVVFRTGRIKNIRVQYRFAAIDVFNKVFDSAGKSEFLILAGTLID